MGIGVFITHASKGFPWSSSTGETVVGIERRNAHGIQSAYGWSRVPRGYEMPNGRWGIKGGELKSLPLPWGLGVARRLPKWWSNGQSFVGAGMARCRESTT